MRQATITRKLPNGEEEVTFIDLPAKKKPTPSKGKRQVKNKEVSDDKDNSTKEEE